MSARAALRLVERPSFYVEEDELWAPDAERGAHSLHYAVSYLGQTPPEVSRFALSKFSRRGDVVVDPFMGGGTHMLEAMLHGRIACGSDANPMMVRLVRAKVQPADITEVTLRLQLLNLRRPVSIEEYRHGFSSFFDIDTFREIVGLRNYLREHDDRVSRFLELLGLGLLHGHSAGFLSVYSLPHMSVSPDEQERLNRKRQQSPEYRAVVPRLLRRAAMLLRDGVPSVLGQQERQSRLAVRDARDLSYLQSGAASLVLTSPPMPGDRSPSLDHWMRLWFSGIDPAAVRGAVWTEDLNARDEWRGFMNESLLELARVTRASARAVLCLREVPVGPGKVWRPDEDLRSLVEQELSRYWDAECALVHRPRGAHAPQQARGRSSGTVHRLLILRRR